MKNWLAFVVLSSGVLSASAIDYLVPLKYEAVPEHMTITFSGYRDVLGDVSYTVKGPQEGATLTDLQAVNKDGWTITAEPEDGYQTPTFKVCPLENGVAQSNQSFVCESGYTTAKYEMAGVYVYDISVKRIPLTVMFNVNGGDPSSFADQVVVPDEAYGELPEPKRTDFTFGGWFIQDTNIDVRVVSTTTVRKWGTQWLKAKWIPNTHWITFDANGGSGVAAPVSQTRNPNGSGAAEAVEIPGDSEFSRVGYELVGWSQFKDAVWPDVMPGFCSEWLRPAGSANYVTLYAVWRKGVDPDPVVHPIDFEGLGTEWNFTTTFTGAEATNGLEWCAFPDVANRAGWTFEGWNLKQGGLLLPKGDKVPTFLPDDSQNLTLVPVWKKVLSDFEQALDVSEMAVAVTNATSGGTCGISEDQPDAEGGKCVGLDLRNSNPVPGKGDHWIALQTTVRGSGTLSFRWKVASAKLYTGSEPAAGAWIANAGAVLEVRKDGERAAAVAAGEVPDGTVKWVKLEDGAETVVDGAMGWVDMTLPVEAASLDTLTDVEWRFTRINLGGKGNAWLDKVTWTPAPSISVAFDGNGGTGTMAAVSVSDGVAATLPANAFVKDGADFAGWALAADGEVALADGTEARFCADTTLYAKWTALPYVVSFDANGGEGTMADQQFVSGQAGYLTPGGFTRAGWEFKGWATSAAGSKSYDDAGLAPTRAMTLYAYWEEHAYEEGESFLMTFMNGEEMVAESEVVAGQALDKAVPDAPVVAGKVFKGWFALPDGQGREITSETLADDSVRIAYAHYVEGGSDDPVRPEFGTALFGHVEPALVRTGATYLGRIVDAAGNLRGTLEVKLAKYSESKGVAKVTASVTMVGGKKQSYKGGTWGTSMATTTLTCPRDARPLTLVLGTAGMSGMYGDDLYVDGALDVFSSKDATVKAQAASLLAQLSGCYTLAYPGEEGWTALSVTVGSKGKSKVTGTLPNGTKVSYSARLLVGEVACCVPVAFSKKNASAVADLWIEPVSGSVAAKGPADAVAARAGAALENGAALSFDTAALAALVGGDVVLADLPDGTSVATAGTKWLVAGGAKAGSEGNPGALKLSFTAKTQLFKGSFKAWQAVGDKRKAVTVTVQGVQVGARAYGSVLIKKKGSLAAEVRAASAH